MPWITLPVGAPVNTIPMPLGVDDLLGGSRVVSYEFDLLDRDEHRIGELTSVSAAGGLSWSASASIKGGGTLELTDVGEEIDWLNVRVRPKVSVHAPNVEDPLQTFTLGVFLASAPKETWTATGRGWSVELLDKNLILDQDIVTDISATPLTYSVPPGVNILERVKDLIRDTGESAAAIEPDDKVVGHRGLVWDLGTTRLKIINDLLDVANYFSLWVDEAGQYRATPWTSPANRPPVYDDLDPFKPGASSLMAPEWSLDHDVFSVPNRFVAIGQGSGEEAATSAVATNEDPDSPYSYPSRGRWITQVETGVEAADAVALLDYAKRRLTSATSVTSSVAVSHAFLPDLRVNATVRFKAAADAAMLNKPAKQLFSVSNTTVPFDPVALCTSTLVEVMNL